MEQPIVHRSPSMLNKKDNVNISKINAFEEEFIFSRYPMYVGPDVSYLDFLTEEIENESDVDPEEKIKSSWYHRAILGDENREIYDDHMDTDFEAVEEYMNMLFEQEEEDVYFQEQNAQILGFEYL